MEISKMKEDYNEIVLDIELDFGLSTFGTCDRLTIYDGKKALLADYKTGISQIDHPSKNYQAKAYTLGVFQKYPEVEEVTFVFYIPLYNDSPHHTFSREDVPALRKELSTVIALATGTRHYWQDGTPPTQNLNPTQNCRFCRHEESCPALVGLVSEVAKKVGHQFEGVEFDDTDDPEQVEVLYDIAKVVEKWAMTYKRNAVQLAKDGMIFPGLKLKSMGATSKVEDINGLIETAKDFGITEKQLLNLASFPLGRLTKAVSETAKTKEKAAIKTDFLDALEEKSIVSKSEERFTLSK
jgi:CRISPR/Cas system-associated exonuclease Cas4 (RecB family)